MPEHAPPPPAAPAPAAPARATPDDERDRLARQLQLALDAARMGWWHYDPVTRVATLDERFRDIFGVSGRVVKDADVLQLFHPDDLPRVWAAVEAALDPVAPRRYAIEYRILRPDGALRWVEAHGLASFEGEGPERRATSFVGTVADVTERKRAESELHDSEARFRAIFESASDALIVTDPAGDGRVLAVNPAACRMFGYAEEEFRKLRRAQMIDPADARLATLLSARDAAGHAAAELTYLRRDGSRFTGELSSTVFVDRAGRRLSVAIIRDVTERRRADAAARQAAEVLELGDAFFELDAAFRVVRVNAQQERISRTPRSRSLGRVFWDVWPEAAPPASPFWREYHRCMEERVPVSFEAHFAPLDVWVSAAAYPASTGGIVVFVREVSDRKRAEQALRESEALYRSLFALAPSGVVLNDARGRILAFNDQACTALGYARDEFANLHLADLDAHEAPPDVEAHIEAIAETGGAEFEVQHRTRDGELRDVLVRTRPVEIGGELRFLNVWQDITERKRLLEELRQSDRRKSEFLGVLSHELRNPLAPIRNGIHLLEVADPASEAARRARQVIRRQTEHLTRLVDDLLDVTRIERGKIVLHRERIDARDVVRRTTDDLDSLFAARGVALAVELPSRPVWVEADPTRLAQVLGNLLQNAAKFTRAGGHVAVALVARDGRAELTVGDDGVGIDPAHLDRMFEPFAQAEHTLARTQGGLGHGLALVRGLVELHGGAVRARSAGLGRGAEFVVALPLAAGAGAARPDPFPAPATAPHRVLVIEDNEDAASTLVELLELQGHAVDVAHDGGSGVARARERRPDVVVCDIGLPDMDGYAVARALRAEHGLRGTRLVALSGYAQPEDRERAREAGFDAHLAKPPDLDQLLRVLFPERPASGP